MCELDLFYGFWLSEAKATDAAFCCLLVLAFTLAGAVIAVSGGIYGTLEGVLVKTLV